MACAALVGCAVGQSASDSSGDSDASAPARAPLRDGPPARIDELLRAGDRARAEGDLVRATQLIEEALSAADFEGLDGETRVAAEGALASLEIDLGRFSQAEARLASAIERAHAIGRPDLELALSHERARALESTAPEAALDAYLDATRRARDGGAEAYRGTALANAAHLAARLSDRAALDEAWLAMTDGERGGDEATPRTAWIRAGRAWLVHAAAERAADDAPEPDDGTPSAVAPHRDALRRAAQAFEAAADGKSPSSDVTASELRGHHALLALARGELGTAEAEAWSAVRAAQRVDARWLEARWHRLLAHIARQRGDRDQSIERLEAAVARIANGRARPGRQTPAELADGLPDELDDRVHVELVDALLIRAHETTEADAAREDLLRAQAVLESFKAAELRNYFRDECVDAYRAKITGPADVSRRAAVVYPIALPDRLVVLVTHGESIRQFVVPVSEDRLTSTTRALRRGLTNRTRALYRAPARTLHAWIVDPIEAHLATLGVDTLVFVPGGSLRTIPVAALHDGETFLVERYAIATIPGLSLVDPRPLARERIDPLFLGLTEARHGFPALPGVADEIGAVSDTLGGVVRLDEAFTGESVERAFERRAFSVVHFATHARFGATAEDSFLLAWDGPFDLDRLADAVRVFREREAPLELLLLSACETASGDDQAALGLAGIAVKSGARSALATLWSVGDQASRRIVVAFYDALLEPDVSRAEALRRAQRALIEDPTLGHPAYWAPFLLISNWL